MANFGAKILNNAISGLAAQQAVIATTSNNIANVNTPGYSRRTAQLQTREGGEGLAVGSGVEVTSVARIADKFLEGLLREARNDLQSYTVQDDFLSRVETLFTLDGEGLTVGKAFTDFYNALNDLSANPASIAHRTNLIERGNDLVSIIKSTFDTVADMQTEADQRIATEMGTVNSLTSQIAQMNQLIASREANGNVAADERDQRDQLLAKLSEKISFTVNEQENGMVDIVLAKGFAVVSGSEARTLDITTTPSFAAGPLPPSLSGQVLSYVVFDYNSGGGVSHIDLTQALQQGGGSVGGLLKLRGYADPANTSAFQANGVLVDIASRVEAYTRQLLTTVNQTYLGPDEDGGTAGWQPSSADLNGVTPGVYGLFDFTFGGVKDANANGQPDDLAALTVDNYSSILRFGVSTPEGFAAARDSNAAAGATSFQQGDNRNVLALSATLQASQTFAMGSYSFIGTFGEAYNEALTFVGNLKASSASSLTVAKSNLVTSELQRDEQSGVSLDEEFSNLIKSQRAYQASARMIRVADELMQEIINSI